MGKILLILLAGYLACGLVFAMASQPQQMWVCPDASAPHGEMTYGDLEEAPRADCRSTVTLGDRARWTGFATALWLPLIVLKGASNAAE